MKQHIPGLTFTITPLPGTEPRWRWGVWVQGQRVLEGRAGHYLGAIADAYVAWVRWEGPPKEESSAVKTEMGGDDKGEG